MPFARFLACSMLVFAANAIQVRCASAQSCDLVQIWVDPAHGVDSGEPGDAVQINDPASPCRTIQFAIDRLYLYLNQLYASDPVTYATWQGIVYCLPGLYGPQIVNNVPTNHGPFASGDAFPIKMRDRVHVQGLNARACVIRGTLVANNNASQGYFPAFWPNAQAAPGLRATEVLVSYRESSQYNCYPELPSGTNPDVSMLPA